MELLQSTRCELQVNIPWSAISINNIPFIDDLKLSEVNEGLAKKVSSQAKTTEYAPAVDAMLLPGPVWNTVAQAMWFRIEKVVIEEGKYYHIP